MHACAYCILKKPLQADLNYECDLCKKALNQSAMLADKAALAFRQMVSRVEDCHACVL